MSRRVLVLFVLVLECTRLSADYPMILYTIESWDALYSQQQDDVELWYSGRDIEVPLSIYRYVPRGSEDLFAVAAAFNLPYDTLATLNGWDSAALMTSGEDILVPNTPGLFVSTAPAGNWERMLSATQRSADPTRVQIRGSNGNLNEFLFYPGEKFAPQERIRFLGSLFTAPIVDARITSGFGFRSNPVTGRPQFHPGVDIRASTGTPVLAARDGVVADTGTLEIYGLFIILRHDSGYETVYAHLDRIQVSQGDQVNAGDQIALSGSSGVSTGPHLHFEVRKNGQPTDPNRLTSFYE